MSEIPTRLPIVRRTRSMAPTPTRRAGIQQRRLIGPADDPHQNAVLIDAEQGALVEPHMVANSESFFLMAGALRVTGPGFDEHLAAGDLCLFPAGTTHGVEVIQGPASFLVIFAPAQA